MGQHGTEEPLLFVLHQQRHEVVDLSHVHIALVVPTDQHLEEDGAFLGFPQSMSFISLSQLPF